MTAQGQTFAINRDFTVDKLALGKPAIEALKVVSLAAPVQEGDTFLKNFPELLKGRIVNC